MRIYPCVVYFLHIHTIAWPISPFQFSPMVYFCWKCSHLGVFFYLPASVSFWLFYLWPVYTSWWYYCSCHPSSTSAYYPKPWVLVFQSLEILHLTTLFLACPILKSFLTISSLFPFITGFPHITLWVHFFFFFLFLFPLFFFFSLVKVLGGQSSIPIDFDLSFYILYLGHTEK